MREECCGVLPEGEVAREGVLALEEVTDATSRGDGVASGRGSREEIGFVRSAEGDRRGKVSIAGRWRCGR